MTRPWRKEEDVRVISIVHSVGKRWIEVTKRYNRESASSRTADSIRNRWTRILSELSKCDFLCDENFEELNDKLQLNDSNELVDEDIIDILFQYGSMDQ